jgi:hypothetical protein
MTQYGYHTKLEEILKTNGRKIKFQKLSFLKNFHNEKVVKSQICRTYKKTTFRQAQAFNALKTKNKSEKDKISKIK